MMEDESYNSLSEDESYDAINDKDYLTIFVEGVGKKPRTVQVPSNCKLDVVFQKVSKLLPVGVDPGHIQLIFAGQEPFEFGSGKTLSDCKIIDKSSVYPAYRLDGGKWPKDALKFKKCNLEPLPGYITVTSSEDDIDIITLDGDPDEKRAKMPCGHVIGPASMTSLCHSLLSEGKFQFHCPECGSEWPYFLVRHVACLTETEMRTLEQELTKNYVAKTSGIGTCPVCLTLCYRGDIKTNRMSCVVCSKLKKGSPDFCWICLRSWKNSSTSKCGNSDCNGLDQRIRILATCPTKRIRDVEVPSMRGCPKCGSLIEHERDCKHMVCPCKYAFCFACLQPKSSDGKWKCTPYGNECGVAPRQTTLPGC